MNITTPNGNSRVAQLSKDYPQQLRDHETRRALTQRYSTAISVANPVRIQFMNELDLLLKKYEDSY